MREHEVRFYIYLNKMSWYEKFFSKAFNKKYGVVEIF